ncbi:MULTISPECIES: hypothetical protein [Pseudomonas]|uniref:4-amino-4-deoxy-L-arabinose-phosphoundecaprenol flippase subunit ArnF n=1 Tax=Pseudomonas citronellolis TaxID=53408 RepID=A0A1A9KHW8_9PSED|nr:MULTISPECIES: hypothetical protein [Pseudomonas]ANI17021.1 hypothetical protein A9C11_24910 [Pseudomonas citronellolis]GLU38647.1 transporter [Pseudomonas sp. NBRC 100443]
MSKLGLLKNVYALILISVAISAFAQVSLKAGMASPSVQKALAEGGERLSILLAVALNPLVLLGLFLYFGSAAVWLLVLSKVQVSFAYPFVALGFVLTALLGRFFFNDTFSAAKVIGTLLIVSGVVVLANGA